MQRVLLSLALTLSLALFLTFLAYILCISLILFYRVRIKLKRFPQIQENQESPFVLNFLPMSVCVWFLCLSVYWVSVKCNQTVKVWVWGVCMVL